MRSFVGAALLLTAGCSSNAPASPPPSVQTLRIGLGASASADAADAGVRQIVTNITTEFLVNYAKDGRPTPVLAKELSTSADGLSLHVALRDVAFHDGTPVTAALAKETLDRRLPQFLGSAMADVREIRAESDRDLIIQLNQPSRFAFEALEVPISKPGAPLLGTGPFKVDSPENPRELVTNEMHADGRPALQRIVLKPYDSIRAAWADLLRGNVDMLYEVGMDALDSLEPSTRVRVLSYRRHYQFVVLINHRRPGLKPALLRRGLSAAIDRQRLIDEALGGRARPSSGPVWPDHWAAPKEASTPSYAPIRLAPPDRPLTFKMLIADPAHERLGIALQRQLRSVGVAAELDAPGASVALKRLADGDFDLVLIDAISAPTLLRPYLFWHSKGPYNYGGYASPVVDSALDSIRHALDDEAYRTGVAAFQRAILDDPPAIFLAWSERVRAISTKFDVSAEPGRDPLSTLRLWRPAGAAPATAGN